MKSSIILVLLLSFVSLRNQAQEIPFYTSDQLNLNIYDFIPIRAEYEELFYDRVVKTEVVSGYILYEVSPTQMWGERNIIFNWSRQGVGATGFDMVITDEDFAVKHRRMPSRGTPGGIIIENHYYGNKVDVFFTNPNSDGSADSLFSYPSSDSRFSFNKIYSHEKKHKRVQNVIIWPYLMASVDWTKYEDFILPVFNPLGLENKYYRLINLGLVEFKDSNGSTHQVRKIIGLSSKSLENLRSADANQPISRIEWFVSNEPPYYYGNARYSVGKDGVELKTMSETLTGYQELRLTYGNRIDTMLEISRDFLKNRNLPWVKWTDHDK